MEEINIKDFFNYLKRYIAAFLILILVNLTAVLIYDLKIKQPLYQARTTVVIAKQTEETNSTVALNDINASQKLVATYGEIAKSELVLNQVIENLNLPTTAKELSKNLSVKPVEDTSILSISVKDPDSERAAVIANEIAKVFIRKISRIYKMDNVSQLSNAEAPVAPANNTTARDTLLTLLATIFMVSGFAFLRFYFDDTVKSSEDTEKLLKLPVAGKISKSDLDPKTNNTELIAESFPKSIVSEDIKSLRTNLQFTAVDQNIKTILVTSTNPSEGKSFISTNLAISFAQADKRVLLIDCDLRKGRIHKIFNVSNRSGLSNLLTDNLYNFDMYVSRSHIKNLSILTCGAYPPNPSELLASHKNNKLISILKNYYDIIIFDGAPVNGLADSTILSSFVDKTLIVVKDANSSKNDLANVRDNLEKVGANIAGVVFNQVKHKAKKYKYYYYGESENA